MKNLIIYGFALSCFSVFPCLVPESGDLFAQEQGALEIAIRKANFAKENTIFSYLPGKSSGKIVASNFEQLVGFDGKLRFPLSNHECKVSIEDTTGKIKTYTVKFIVDTTTGSKPAVIPALQEWCSSPGEFILGEDVVLWRKDAKIPEIYLKNFARDIYSLTGIRVRIAEQQPKNGKCIAFALGANSRLGKEGYALSANPNNILIEGVEAIGVNWGMQTLLQVFKNSSLSNGKRFVFPCGKAIDYPQYPVRGFLYDVGRKPATLQAVRNVVRTMAYYKLNDLQLHLNDNFIWLHDYTKIPNGKQASDANKKAAIREVLDAAPTGYRLESKVPGLTSTDFAYTKKEFLKLQKDAANYGVKIVPEIDVPGHAMSFVKVRPDLMYRGEIHKPHDVERAAMLDASNEIFDKKTGKTYREETLKFVQNVMDEYLLPGKDGEKVFSGDVFHIGTDEYYGNAEDYRAFADAMLKYVKSRGYTPRLWGSLSIKQGKTPVDGTGSQIHVWNLGWQDPHLALKHNFDVINIVDHTSYMVPNGTGNVGGYGDYLDLAALYRQNWQPHTMGNRHLLPGHPKLLGAQFALWNDNSWRRDTGLTDYDLFDRIQKSGAVIAEKTWARGADCSYAEFNERLNRIDVPPGINPRYEIDKTRLELDSEYKRAKCVNAEILEWNKNTASYRLKGNCSYVKFPHDNSFAPNYKVKLRVKRNSTGTGEEILFSSPACVLKAVQKETGKLGFTRDAWDFSFDYVLPINKTVELLFVTKGRTTTLYADGKKIGSPIRHKFPESHKYSTMIFPMQFVGAPKNSFCGDIQVLSIEALKPRSLNDCVKIKSAKASSEQGKGADGDITKAIDGNKQTYWHSKYAPTKDKAPFNVDLELAGTHNIDAVSYFPRQDNQNNGTPEKGEIYARIKGNWKKIADFDANPTDKTMNTIEFPAVETDAIRFVIIKGASGFGTLAEIYVHEKAK